MRRIFYVGTFLLCLSLTSNLVTEAGSESTHDGGVIHLEDGDRVEFEEVLSLIFSLREGAEGIPQNVSEWPLEYSAVGFSRSLPLAWMRSLRVEQYEIRERYRCIFNPTVSMESISGVVIPSAYRSLEWIKVRTRDAEGNPAVRRVFFSDGEKLNIREIRFYR